MLNKESVEDAKVRKVMERPEVRRALDTVIRARLAGCAQCI